MIRGWQFDADGRVTELPEEAKKSFPDEAEAVSNRYAERATQAAADSERRGQAAAARHDDQQARQAAMQDDGPVLTAMQAAMQQAQADLAGREEESSES